MRKLTACASWSHRTELEIRCHWTQYIRQIVLRIPITVPHNSETTRPNSSMSAGRRILDGAGSLTGTDPRSAGIGSTATRRVNLIFGVVLGE
jgi:hypothetical protein